MFDVRPVADQEEFGRAVGAIGQYFNPPPNEEFLELFARLLPHERMHAAFMRATQLEWIFWDSAYRLEAWPV